MAGIYVHIPFCKKACHYCDFTFSTSHHSMELWVEALLFEIEKQQQKLINQPIDTLYFGGGTPSLLPPVFLENILKKINDTYTLQLQEFTIEANPEDLTASNLNFWKSLGCNRLSIGVQSFQEKVLKWMNRGHDAKMAIKGIERAKRIGFENMSVDLIYNLPFDNFFKKDLMMFLDFELPHYSAYTLTIEANTVFGHRLKKKQLHPLSDKKSINEMEEIHHKMLEKGYEHYEISNFALPNFISKHNSNYWNHIPYLGLGSGAHSFIDNCRWYNITNNWLYIKAIKNRKSPILFYEKLTDLEMLNEKIMFGLRTIKGFNLEIVEGAGVLDATQKQSFYNILSYWKNSGHLHIQNQQVILTLKGLFIADTIIEDLFTL